MLPTAVFEVMSKSSPLIATLIALIFFIWLYMKQASKKEKYNQDLMAKKDVDNQKFVTQVMKEAKERELDSRKREEELRTDSKKREDELMKYLEKQGKAIDRISTKMDAINDLQEDVNEIKIVLKINDSNNKQK